MAKTSKNKRTKKYTERHLQGDLERRRAFKAKRDQIERRKKGYGARGNGKSRGKGGSAIAHGDGESLQDLSVDDFLQGGWESVGQEEGEGEMEIEQGEEEEEEEDGEEGGKYDESEEEVDDALLQELDVTAARHKQDLEELKSKDPEFYRYLEENDSDLLHFDREVKDLNKEDNVAATSIKAKQDDNQVIDATLLRTWQHAIVQEHSLRAFKRLLLAFQSACYVDEEEDPRAVTGKGKAKARTKKNGRRAFKPKVVYTIHSPKIFHKVILTTLHYVPNILTYYLPYRETTDGRIKVPTHSSKHKILAPLIKSFVVSVLHFISKTTSQDLRSAAASACSKVVPWITGMNKLVRQLTTTMLDLWSSHLNQDETRLAAFLAIQRLSLSTKGDRSTLQRLLKSTYLCFLRNCKITNGNTMAGITLMKNSMVLLFGVDEIISYQVAFGYIRQLAIHLRGCIQKKKPESVQSVYNWQFAHGIDLWALVLCTYCDKRRLSDSLSPLHDLLYPLVQVAVGSIRHMPTSRFFPFRFQICRSMLLIIQRTRLFIPLIPQLFEVLESHEVKSKGKPSTLKPIDLEYLVRAPQQYLGTAVYQQAVQEECLYIMLEYFTTSSLSISLPELIIPPVVQLKRYMKKCKNAKLNRELGALVDRLQDNAKFIHTKRQEVEFAPNQHEQVHAFLAEYKTDQTPLGIYLKLQKRYRDERRAILEAARLENGMTDGEVGEDNEDELEEADEEEEEEE